MQAASFFGVSAISIVPKKIETMRAALAAEGILFIAHAISYNIFPRPAVMKRAALELLHDESP
jgi:hypothetical protein